MNPTINDLVPEPKLTSIMNAQMQAMQNKYAAGLVFPKIPVQTQSSRYITFDRDSWAVLSARQRAPGTESAGGHYSMEKSPKFSCEPFAVHKDIPDLYRAAMSGQIDMNLDDSAANYCAEQLMMAREYDFMTKFMKPGIWKGGPTGTDYRASTFWGGAMADPIREIQLLRSAVKSRTGIRPNSLVLSDDAYWELANNALVVDRIKYTQKGIVEEDMLKALLGLDYLIHLDSVITTQVNDYAGGKSNPNYIPGTRDFALKDTALLLYTNPNANVLDASAGYMFSWDGYLQGNRRNEASISTIEMPLVRALRVEAEACWAMELVAPDLGVYINGIVDPAAPGLRVS